MMRQVQSLIKVNEFLECMCYAPFIGGGYNKLIIFLLGNTYVSNSGTIIFLVEVYYNKNFMFLVGL